MSLEDKAAQGEKGQYTCQGKHRHMTHTHTSKTEIVLFQGLASLVVDYI